MHATCVGFQCFAFVLFSVSACEWKPKPRLRASRERIPGGGSPRYFPEHLFSNDDRENNFKDNRYVKHLSAMDEPSLWEASKDSSAVIYRFLWLRTFHHPVAVRLTLKADGTAYLIGKTTSGQGGYGPGTISITKSVDVSAQEIGEFTKLLDDSAFWSSPTELPPSLNMGLDGAQWLLEAAKDGEYHAVDRWSPRDGAHRKACLYLLTLSGIAVPAKEIY
jgi:hypothetical protein